MKFMKWTMQLKKQNIFDETRTKSALKKILYYRKNWICYVHRTQGDKLCKLMVKYLKTTTTNQG
jgi:hypothetical protein